MVKDPTCYGVPSNDIILAGFLGQRLGSSSWTLLCRSSAGPYFVSPTPTFGNPSTLIHLPRIIYEIVQSQVDVSHVL